MGEDTINIFLAGLRECKKGWVRGRQSALAKAIDTPEANLSGILSGSRPVSLDLQTRIAAELGKSYEDMLALGRQTMNGEPPKERTDTPLPPHVVPQSSPPEHINISEGRLMAEMVLLSNTRYAGALWANLKSFAEAVRNGVQGAGSSNLLIPTSVDGACKVFCKPRFLLVFSNI